MSSQILHSVMIHIKLCRFDAIQTMINYTLDKMTLGLIKLSLKAISLGSWNWNQDFGNYSLYYYVLYKQIYQINTDLVDMKLI